VTSPNRPRCGDLTPHGRHPLPGSEPLDAEWCPGVPNLAEPAAQPISRSYWEGWIVNENPADRDARVRAQALRDFAESMRVLAEDAPADEPAKWPWSGYALAAVKAEEYAGKGFPRHEDSTEQEET
jgi:hypothetical protein